MAYSFMKKMYLKVILIDFFYCSINHFVLNIYMLQLLLFKFILVNI